MKKNIELIKKINVIHYFVKGRRLINDAAFREIAKKNELEIEKTPSRTEVINFLLSTFKRETTYLEIGVRNPNDNFNQVNANKKYSVDPGFEFNENPVDFNMTSDMFFEGLKRGEVLARDIKFDVIFIDGLHLAEQVDRDILNALEYVKADGYIALHDCNPPSEWHARTNYGFIHSPAAGYWNGTTWKAFIKYRMDKSLNSCCIDTDWGVGILSKTKIIGEPLSSATNPFYEFGTFENDRQKHLNLISFNELKTMLV